MLCYVISRSLLLEKGINFRNLQGVKKIIRDYVTYGCEFVISIRKINIQVR